MQIAVSANDNKAVLVNGASRTARNPAPDTITVLDLDRKPPKVLAEVEVPTSVVGPPFSVAITPDQNVALVTAAMKVDPTDPTRQVPDNRMSVVDLTATPPRVLAQLETGLSPTGVSITRQGTLALVANRLEGTVSVFTIRGKTVTPAGKVRVADAKAGVSHAAITPDGRMALVTRDGDDRISVLSIAGADVRCTGRQLFAGLRPYGIDVASTGAFAVVANVGRDNGDADTVSLVDLAVTPPRVVDTVTVGQAPEGVEISPDASVVAVVTMNGSNKPRESPFFNDAGRLVLLRLAGGRLTRFAEAPIGHWSQGAAFSADGTTILVGNMVERDVQVFELSAGVLTDTGHRIKVNGGSAAIRTADR